MYLDQSNHLKIGGVIQLPPPWWTWNFPIQGQQENWNLLNYLPCSGIFKLDSQFVFQNITFHKTTLYNPIQSGANNKVMHSAGIPCSLSVHTRTHTRTCTQISEMLRCLSHWEEKHLLLSIPPLNTVWPWREGGNPGSDWIFTQETENKSVSNTDYLEVTKVFVLGRMRNRSHSILSSELKDKLHLFCTSQGYD